MGLIVIEDAMTPSSSSSNPEVRKNARN